MFMLRRDYIRIHIYININILLSGFFPYGGYYSETDRTGTVQRTIHSSQRPPPTTMMYIPTTRRL